MSVELILGDCLEVMRDVDYADVMITDPPYSSGGFQEAGKSVGSIGTRQNDKIAGDVLSTRGYLRLMKRVFQSSHADEFFVFTDWRMWINTFDAMEDGYIRVRNMLVWNKRQMGMGLPWRSQHELIAYGKRTPAQNITGKHGNVITIKRTRNDNHPTEKPVPLIRRLLTNTNAQTVIDPFMGSGSVGVACILENRNFIGIEIDPDYFAIAERRIKEAQMQPRLEFG